MTKAVSIDPDDLQEGTSGVPWGKNQTCIDATTKVLRMEKGKSGEGIAWNTDPDDLPEGVNMAPGIELTFRDDEGGEGTAFLSAGSTKRLVPSEDGENASDEGSYLIPNPNLDEDAQEKIGITKKSALGHVLGELVNAGYPQSRMKKAGGNLREIFEGTYGFWEQVTVKLGTNSSKVVVPEKIEMAEDAPKKAPKKTEAAELDDDDQEKAIGLMVKLAKAAVKEHSEVSRADFAGMVTEQFEDDKKVSADMLAFMGEVLYKKAFTKALGAADLELDGETIKAE